MKLCLATVHLNAFSMCPHSLTKITKTVCLWVYIDPTLLYMNKEIEFEIISYFNVDGFYSMFREKGLHVSS